MTVLVGGVGQLFQGDLDLGRRVVEKLAAEDFGPHVIVEDLHYGAVAVAQRLQEISPGSLVLVGASQRGRTPGAVERRRIHQETLPPSVLQQSVADAVTGYVTIDLLLDVGTALRALPSRVVTIEIEPVITTPSEELSPEVGSALDTVLEKVRTEILRAPALEVAGEIRALLGEGRVEESPATGAMRELLDALELVDSQARWGATFSLRDRVRESISIGQSGQRMSHLDWGLWWALLEELDRLQKLESSVEEPGDRRSPRRRRSPASRGSEV